jgi:4-hydroxysphinganine ceramide fatty acyl 2-hydroxylase
VSQVDEMTPAFSLKDVSRHCSEQDAWVVVDGRVYDVSGFLPSHPGGLDVLHGHLGTDVSEILRSPDYHRHSSTAYQILEQCCIGVLKDAQLNHQDFKSEKKHKKWKEEDLIDWSKPLLSQITHLGEVYDDWVHTPVNHNLRLFQSDLLESCTKCPWWLVPLCWIPYSFYMMWLATTHIPSTLPWIAAPTPLNWVAVVALLPIGVLIWTLIEYCLHRFIFHMEPPRSGLWIQFHFAIHGQHHKVPFDNMRLVFPPVPAGIIMLILYVSLLHVFSLAPLRAMFAGGILGYISYDLLHYFFHHGSPRPGSYLANLKSYHIAHHYINPNLGFGVSSKLWDIPFATTLKFGGSP